MSGLLDSSRVLVLDADQRSALAVTRSLGRQGLKVFTADCTETALAAHSRFSARYLRYANPRTAPRQFLSDVVRIAGDLDVGVLYPVREISAALLIANRDRLAERRLPFPAADVVARLIDKNQLFRLAQSLDVPIPRTHFVDSPADLSAQLDGISYPAVLKPARSQIELPSGEWLTSAVRIAQDRDELERLVQASPDLRDHPFTIQEFIDGHGQGVFSLYREGSPIAWFAHRRIREKPPGGGVSVLSESIPLDPALRALSERLLTAVGWHGVAMVEFKVASDGTPYLMEINTRFWGSLQLAIDSGVDFPALLHAVTTGRDVAPVEIYRESRRLRWLLGDLDRLYLVLKDSSGRYGLRSKLVETLRFVLSWPPSKHEVDRLEDPGPGWHELRAYLRAVFSALLPRRRDRPLPPDSRVDR